MSRQMVPWMDNQIDATIDRQIDRQTDRQIGRQIGRQTDRQTDRQVDRQVGRQVDRQVVGQADRYIRKWQVDKQRDRQIARRPNHLSIHQWLLCSGLISHMFKAYPMVGKNQLQGRVNGFALTSMVHIQPTSPKGFLFLNRLPLPCAVPVVIYTDL